ncbi:cryptochrome/deoxyribodipyrimidine photo-lyase family protein [Pareuzebyella sediminis]|uniref:cryptochrome/deoxyribodipyrimidine photo-lyase family protein n=1 Tax=Pareuzebyella sediminis TaxID=2607998 RepID=UPI0018E18ED5|nr:FAD-binding domain-containing protein [Pareuzebyella sediminis]
MVKKAINIVWFKRDLRLQDNEALNSALMGANPTLLLYLHEPKIWSDPHYDVRHLTFVKESLSDINQELINYNTKVLCVTSEVEPFFDIIQKLYQIGSVFSTEESGLQVTYRRDIEFGKYCKRNHLEWCEFQNNGVIRGLKNRKTWRKSWYHYMNSAQVGSPMNVSQFVSTEELDNLYSRFEIFSLEVARHDFQKGGRTQGLRWKKSFFHERIEFYNQFISKPEMSRYGCSRLSPYFAWGNLSIREVFQEAKAYKLKSPFKRQANAFMSRLRWQSHFIQKFEQEPRMEFEAINRGFLGLEQPLNKNFVSAWMNGKTGYPLVDASMRCVKQTGYLNFRMRSMVVSFLTHHLFQHFTTGGAWLARQFLDFEPGIHYGQMQMQAGFTGTNTVRIYNPVKNALEHDTDAIFIQKFVPELSQLPAALAIQPWTIEPMEESMYRFTYGVDYPTRIVDIEKTRKIASQKLYGQRKNTLAVSEKERILETHTMRRTEK